jgi:hypothetical protein
VSAADPGGAGAKPPPLPTPTLERHGGREGARAPEASERDPSPQFAAAASQHDARELEDAPSDDADGWTFGLADALTDALEPAAEAAPMRGVRRIAAADRVGIRGVRGTPPQNTTATSAPRGVLVKVREFFGGWGSDACDVVALGVRCIAPLMVDGGTRVALAFDPHEPLPPHWDAELERLRAPRSREEHEALRNAGGLLTELVVDGRRVHAKVQLRGTRRERIVLHVPDRAYVEFDLELGRLSLQLKAKELWAEGYADVAFRWMDCFSRLFLSRALPRLADAHAMGWRVTGLEVCSDFVGLPRWQPEETRCWVGSRRISALYDDSALDDARSNRAESHNDGTGYVQTFDLGSRRSPTMGCLYDKDEQLFAAKPERAGGTPRGDDSTYRAVHLANGWDGATNRQRVEFRWKGEALMWEHVYSRKGVEHGTGEVWNFRDPATLADRDALAFLWRKTTEKKRMIDPRSATRRERCKIDDRWRFVQDVCEAPDVDLSQCRQRREVACDTYDVRVRRAARSHVRATRQLAEMHDHSIRDFRDCATIGRLAEYIVASEEDGGRWVPRYAETYRKLQDGFVGEEIVTLGRRRYAAIVHDLEGGWIDDTDLPAMAEVFTEAQLERMLALKRKMRDGPD